MKAAAGEPTVDSYLAKQPPGVRKVLDKVRALIKKVLPGAEERISYQIPSYRLDGVTVIFFAGWKEHYALYPVNENVVRALGEDPSSFVLSKGTIRLPYDRPLPEKLIRAIVAEKKASAAEIALARASKKSKTKAAKKPPSKKIAKKETAKKIAVRTEESPVKKTATQKIAKSKTKTVAKKASGKSAR